jgi:alpha-D-ribose 1-methylphosphonate 5-triphosphate synthase subunit PhnL
MTLLEARGLRKTFRIHEVGSIIEALRGVDIEVGAGQFIGITGRSGSGKSTVLKMIYRSYLPDAGEILYDSAAYGPLSMNDASERQIIALRKKEIGYVSQFLHALPRTTARAFVAQACAEAGMGPEEAGEAAKAMLEQFELHPSLHDSYAQTFSGGEKLRLNIAGAMVRKPRLLLLDEPTASLDERSKGRVRELIVKLKKEGTTMLGIFHDIEFMEGLCDGVYRMEGGRVIEAPR